MGKSKQQIQPQKKKKQPIFFATKEKDRRKTPPGSEKGN